MFNIRLSNLIVMFSKVLFGRQGIFGAVVVFSAIVIAAPVVADDFEWTDAANGMFMDAAPWTRLTGTGSAPPGLGDTAIFNEGSGAYTSTFTSDRTTSLLEIIAGDVTFRSSGTDRTYTLSDDVFLGGGNLTLGVAGDPLNLSVTDAIRVRNDSLLNVLHGSVVDVMGSFRIGDASGDGNVIIDGDNSMLFTSALDDAFIGSSGGTGTLTLNNSATALIGQNLNIAAPSSFTGTSGTVDLNTGAAMTVGGDINMVTGTNSGQIGFLNVNEDTSLNVGGNLNIGTGTSTSQFAFLSVIGAGATCTQSGGGTIDIGGVMASGNLADISVIGGTFSSGTGAITIHPTGTLDIASAGSFTANGPVTLENGGTFFLDGGDFEATAGFDANSEFADQPIIDIRDGTFTVSGGNFSPGGFNSHELELIGTEEGDVPQLVISSGATGDFNGQLRVDRGGTVTVIGAGSALETTNSVTIGNFGTATLDILDGGTVECSGTMHLGFNNNGDGTITVDGEGSLLETGFILFQIQVGPYGTGRLNLNHGGEVRANSLHVGSNFQAQWAGDGRVRLLNGSHLNVSENVYVAGNDAMASGGVGVIELLTATVQIDDTLRIWDTGQMIIRSSGAFFAADTVDNSHGGTFELRQGTLQVVNFIGDLVNEEGALAPGPDAAPTTINGDYTQQTGAMLDMEIGGTSPGGTHDLVIVTGVADVDGELKLTLIDGFVPDPDDEFFLLSATTLNGFFDNINTGQRLDVTGGEGSFVVNYGFGSAFPSNQIVLSDFQPNGPNFVTPDSFMVTRGQYFSGDETDLAASDNNDLSLRRLGSDIQSRTEFEVKGISPIESPSSLEFTLEGAVFARSNVVQTIELFDYVAAAWEIVDTQNTARSPAPDLVVTAAATGDLSRFVEPGTMCIEARIRYKSDNPRQNFASNTDQAMWSIQ